MAATLVDCIVPQAWQPLCILQPQCQCRERLRGRILTLAVLGGASHHPGDQFISQTAVVIPYVGQDGLSIAGPVEGDLVVPVDRCLEGS